MGSLWGGLCQARTRWDSPGGGGVGTSVAGGVGGTLLLLRGRPWVGVGGVAGAGTVVAEGVVGAGPAVVGRAVGAGPVVGRVAVGARSSAGRVVGEGPRGGCEEVGAGPAVARGGVVSGDGAEEDAGRALWTVARGAPVFGVRAVGAAALEKGGVGSLPSLGSGDASTCPAAPGPPVTFLAEVAEAAAAAAAAAQHNRARPPRLGRLFMARSAPPFIHSVSRPVSHLLLPALGPGKPPQPPPPPSAPSPPPSDRRPAPRAGPSAEGATRPCADSPPSPIGSLVRRMGGHAGPRDPPAPWPLCSFAGQSEDVEGRGRCQGGRRVARAPL